METDRNFDGLAGRLNKKIYGSLKGKIRLKVLEKDLTEFLPEAMAPAAGRPLRILDAGGGTGPFSVSLARLGHRITLCDLSKEMLALAEKNFADHGVPDRLTLCEGPIQGMDPGKFQDFDLILCHAVVEWVPDPEQMLQRLLAMLKPGGGLSLTFYNRDGLVFKNLLRANYKKVLEKSWAGYPGSLTPTWPRTVSQVQEWLAGQPFECLCHSGIRVFHDYILDPEDQAKDPATVLQLELAYSRIPPFRDLGRYQHLLGIKTEGLPADANSRRTAVLDSNRQ